MAKGKSLPPIIYIIIIALLCFYGGFYTGKKSATGGNETDLSLFSDLGGYGTIKNIATNGLTITLSSQINTDKDFKVNISPKSRFFESVAEENEELKGLELKGLKPVGLENFKTNDKVYFLVNRSHGDNNFTLQWLSISGE